MAFVCFHYPITPHEAIILTGHSQPVLAALITSVPEKTLYCPLWISGMAMARSSENFPDLIIAKPSEFAQVIVEMSSKWVMTHPVVAEEQS